MIIEFDSDVVYLKPDFADLVFFSILSMIERGSSIIVKVGKCHVAVLTFATFFYDYVRSCSPLCFYGFD